MRSLHSTNDLKIDTDPYKLIKKFSPRNTESKKTFNNSPAIKSPSANSSKKPFKETKKSLDQPVLNRVLPSRS